MNCMFFIASALWADALYKSKCPSVCPSVRPSVCSLLRFRLNVFLPPLTEVGCPIFLEIQNPWGWKEVVSDLNIFVWKWSKIPIQKKSFFWLILPYKTRWKPRFPMDQRPLVEERIANFGIFLDFLSFCVLNDFFLQFFTQFRFWGILGSPGNHAF